MKITFLLLAFLLTYSVGQCNDPKNDPSSCTLRSNFLNPPDSARPGVYWYFMDGNMSKEAMTEDLESMKRAGIGNVLFLEVNVGIPRGSVDFLSDQWQEMFTHGVRQQQIPQSTVLPQNT